MFSKKLTRKILKAQEEMDVRDFYDFLINNDEIQIDDSDVEICINFAARHVSSMNTSLQKGEWYGYELRALNALEKLKCDENGIIGIDSYGFPYDITDNGQLLDALHLTDYLCVSELRLQTA